MQKNIVITGCSSGFGRCSALELARRGWYVFATVRKEEDRVSLLAEAETQHCNENISALLCDITNREQVEALAHAVEEELRHKVAADTQAVARLDALLNNAGTAYGGPVEMVALDDLRAQFEINVVAHVSTTQVFLPMLKAAKGTIINVSSISGRISIPVTGVYSASKFALEAISDALRLEVAPFGVHVVLIEPASSPTAIWKTSLQRSQEKLGQQVETSPYARLLQGTLRMIERSDKVGFPIQLFANLVVKILASPKPRARYAVPITASIILLLRRFLPDRGWDFLIRRMLRW